LLSFAILEHSKGKELVAAALDGARLRLRPILMTSFAFILGCVPLWTAKGAGAIGRKVLGSSVITAMSAASALGIFFVPVLFVIVERIAKKKAHVEVPQQPCWKGPRLMRKLVAVALLPLLSFDRDARRPSTTAQLSNLRHLLFRGPGKTNFNCRLRLVGFVKDPVFKPLFTSPEE